MTRIFISHAAADRDFVDAFVDTIVRLGCGVPRESIFYSSGADTGVPSGADLSAYVRDQVSDDALVVAVLTPTFQTRPFCIAELGAAWSRAGRLFPVAVPGLAHSQLDGVLAGTMVKRLDQPSTLDELHDEIGRAIKLSTDALTWGQYRDKWIREVGAHMATLSAVPFSDVVSSTSCSRGPGHMELFWTDRSSNVLHRWWLAGEGWSRVHRLEDVNADFLAAVSADGQELLFGVQGKGQVWVRSWVENSYGSVHPADDVDLIPGEVVGPLTALSRGWEVEVVAWTPEGQPCHLWRQGDGWTDWMTTWE